MADEGAYRIPNQIVIIGNEYVHPSWDLHCRGNPGEVGGPGVWRESACYRIAPDGQETDWMSAGCGSYNREIGAPGRIRTPDPQIRSLVLYPAELPAPRPVC